jgi:hypothetical protein
VGKPQSLTPLALSSTGKVGFLGYNNRPSLGSVGLVFDTVDAMLGYQGLPTASGRDYIISAYKGSAVSGHSLGTLDASYMVGNGLAKSGVLYALPFGNIAPAGLVVNIGALDPITGGASGKLLNWGARVCSIGVSHSLNQYAANMSSCH